MQALNHPFELTSRQKWINAGLCTAVVAVLIVIAGVLGNSDISDDGSTILLFIAMGLATGLTVRLGTKRGWSHYAEKYQPGAQYAFNKELKLGVLWRVLAVWFAGRFLIVVLASMVGSEDGAGILLFVALAVMIAAALYIGLRFGWRSADSMLSSPSVATAT